MKKRLLVFMTLLTVALMFALSVTAYAGSSEVAEGLWQYQPFIDEVRFADGNTFLKTFENGIWSGTFSGTSTEKGKVVAHSSGTRSFKGEVSFDGEVNGKSGKLTILAVGSKPDASSNWTGKWVILSGTDDLSSLHGEGIWWGPGAPGPGEWGDIYYSGNIHFDPE